MRIALGIPTIGDVPGEVFGSHLMIACEVSAAVGPGNAFTVTPIGAVPHDNARQLVVDKALELKATHIFFVDADTAIPKGGFLRLKDIMDTTKAPVVSGHYLRRGYPYTSVWSAKHPDGGGWCQVDAPSGVHQIGATGFGCCLVDLEWAVAHVPKPWFKMKQNDLITEVTDDIVFMEAVTKAGGQILGCADVRCSHFGNRQVVNDKTATLLRGLALENDHARSRNESEGG